MTGQTTRRVLSPKTRTHQIRLVALLASTALVHSTAVLAQSLPSGGQVAAGSASIGTPSAGSLTINQTSGSAVVNWQSFDVGRGNRVTFVQPDANSAILNRVTGQTTSTISGQINANGQVYLINPNGIAITNTGTVKAGAFVASTLGISDDDFMGGKRTFSGNGASAPVTNAGAITINRGGYMALIGGTVANSGVITVPMGKAALGSGEQATLDLSGDGFLQVAMPTKAGGSQALVENSGRIAARGGAVQLTAAAARDMARQAVNMSGTIEAKGVSGRSGDIILSGGDGEVAVTGKLDASNRRGSGGKVQVTGRKITLANAKINASGKTGGGTVTIGGERQGKGTLQHAETLDVDASTVIRADAITTGNGGNVVLWSDDLTRFAGTITAKGGAISGNGGEVEVSGKAKLSYTGLTDLTAAHGSFGNLLLDPYDVTISTGTDSNADGSFNATGNDSVINVNTLTNALATANVTVTTGSSGTQAGVITVAAPIAWASGSTLTLNAASDININAAITATAGGLTLASGGTITAPAAVSIGGTFNLASGNWVQNATTLAGFSAGDFQLTGGSFLRVTGGDGSSATPYKVVDVYGLQGIGSSGASLAAKWTLANDIDASRTANWNNGAGFAPIGRDGATFTGSFDGGGNRISGLTINRPGTDSVGLFGYIKDGAAISNVGLVGGTVTGHDYVGGLVGVGLYGTISNVYATGTVNGGIVVGGLVGMNGNTILNAYATGAVSGNGLYWVGGLVGYSWGSIENAYATGAVSGNSQVGGLVGASYGTIINSYASGAVTGNYSLGGLVGVNNSGSNIANSFWDVESTGQSSGYGENYGSFSAAGLTAAQARNAFSYAAWDFNGTWYQSGDMRPILRSEAATADANGVVTISNLHQLALIGANLAGSYKLANDLDAGATSGTNAADIWSTSGWVPVGSYDAAFTGTLDGAGHTIAGLTVNRGINYVGMFGNSAGTIENIGLIGASVNGYSYAGGLVGNNTGTISNAYTTGAVSGSQNVGGLAGYNSGSITNGYSTAAVSGSYDVGGLVGYNHGSISNSYAAGAVYGASIYVGGLVGYSDRSIRFAYATGSVTGNTYVGGLVGYNDSGSTIDNAYASGAVNGSVVVGGLVGRNYYSTITNSFWDVSTTGQSSGYGQSFSGTFSATGLTTAQARSASSYSGWDFANSWYQTGDMRPILRSEAATADANGVIAINNLHQLALIGANLASNYMLANNIDASETSGANASGIWSTGGWVPLANINTMFSGSLNGNNHTISGLTVTGYDQVGLFAASAGSISNLGLVGGSVAGVRSNVGALAGWNYGTISNSYSTATVSGLFEVGGLVGMNIGTISSSYATGPVSGSNAFVGGLVGYNSGAIINAYATGAVSGGAVGTGGLVGNNSDRGGTINSSYATGSVSGGSRAGGLAGDNGGTITNAYASGAVSGTDTVGGLVGGNYAVATISNSYAIGAVTGGGGLTGQNDGTVTASFWDMATTGQVDGTTSGSSTGMTGMTTAQMADPFTFIDAGWDLASVWGKSTSGANGGYMMLRALSSGLYDDYVKIGSGTRTYGDANSAITGATLSGVGTGNVSFAWGSAIAGTTNAGTYNYSDPNIVSVTETGARTAYVDYGGTLTISQRVLSLSGGRTYDGTTNVSAGNLTLSNLANGETLTLSGIGAMADKNAGLGKAVSLGSLLLGDSTQGDGGLASNYTLVGGTDTVDIAKAIIASIGGITASGKTYDGTTGVTLNTSGATFNGVVVGDSLTLGTGFSGAFSDKNAGAGKTVSISGLSLSGTDAGNYTLASGTATTLADIARAYVFFGGTSVSSKVYDGTTAATVTISTVPVISTDDMHVAYTSASFSDKNAGMSKTVSINGLYITGADAGNYQLAITDTTSYGIITPAIITSIGGITVNGKAYDGTTAAALNTSGAVFNGVIGNDVLTVGSASGDFSDQNVGIGKTVAISGLTLGGADALNYRLDVTTATAFADIGQRILSLSGSRTYNGGTDLDAAIFSLGNLVGGETLTLSGTGSMADKNVGSGKAVSLGSLLLGDSIQGDGGLASNYTLSGGIDTVDITRAIISSIGGIAASGKTYDGTTGASLDTSHAVFNGLIGSDTLSIGNAIGSFSDKNADTGKTVSISGLTLSGADAGNYTLVDTTASSIADIGKRAITVSADNASRVYGDANPALTYTLGGAGLVAGDTLSGNLATSADGTSGVGAYGITQGSLAASANYDLTFTGASLTVTPRAITVSASNASRIYGDANPALSYTVGGRGLVNNDSLTGALSTSADLLSAVGAYDITQGSLAALGNYDLTFVGGTLAVTPRAITVAANSASRIYGDANPIFSYSVNGLINGDALTGALSTDADPLSHIGTYSIGLGSLGNANYAISYSGGNLTIVPRSIIVTANNASRATGAANPLFTYAIAGAGLANGDRLFGQLATAADRRSGAGSYAITRGSLVASADYDMSFVDGVLTVTAAPASASTDLASTVIPRSFAPANAAPLPPVQRQGDSAPTFASDPTGDGSHTFLADPRYDGTVVCLGNGAACVVQPSQ